MRLLYNPKKVGDKLQAWRCFLIGSLFTSSFIFFAITENVLVFFAALAMMAAAVLMFLDTNINFRTPVYLFQNLASAGLGLAVSVGFYLYGFLLVYLWITVVLVLATWLHKLRVRGRQKDEGKPEKKKAEEKSEK